MKPVLLHGAAIKSSRIKLHELKSKFHADSVMVFDKDADVEKILTNLNSISLFEGERLVILENTPEDLITSLSPVANCLSLVLWFDHQLKEGSGVLKWIREQKGEVLNFSEGKEISIFPFLDLLVNKDKRAFLELKKIKEADLSAGRGGFDIFYFLTMVFYLLRNLVATPKNAPPFVKQKLERQRKNFTPEEIIGIYRNLLEIDFKMKSGLLEVSQAEFLMVKMFVPI